MTNNIESDRNAEGRSQNNGMKVYASSSGKCLEVHELDEHENLKDKLEILPFCEGEAEMEYVECPAEGTFVFRCVCDEDYCDMDTISVCMVSKGVRK